MCTRRECALQCSNFRAVCLQNGLLYPRVLFCSELSKLVAEENIEIFAYLGQI